MRIERHKNFLSEEDCATLNAWVREGVSKKWLDGACIGYSDKTPNKKRFTTRMYGDRFEYPQIVLNIADSVRSFCGIDTYPIIEGHGKNGVVVSCMFDGGDLYEHKDQMSNNLMALRCNVMTSAPEVGGQLYVGNKLLDIKVGELHCYLASKYSHKVTTMYGNTERILWMFGAYVPPELWENGTIKFGHEE